MISTQYYPAVDQRIHYTKYQYRFDSSLGRCRYDRKILECTLEIPVRYTNGILKRPHLCLLYTIAIQIVPFLIQQQ